MTERVAKVVVDIRSRAVDRAYDYVVPAAWTERIRAGQRVYVPFGRQHCLGYVVGLEERPTALGLKPILDILDEQPPLTEELLAVAEWLCERYACTHLEALQTMLPSAFRVTERRQYRAVGDQPPEANGLAGKVWASLRRAPASFDQIVGRFGPDAALVLEHMLQTGCVDEVRVVRNRTESRTEAFLVRTAGAEQLRGALAARAQRAPKQARLLELLLETDEFPLRAAGCLPSDQAVAALIRDGFAEVQHREWYRAPAMLVQGDDTRGEALTVWQERALRSILNCAQRDGGRTVVLHGVTGSGKTEVYMRALEKCLAEGGSALVLVPEISLTPQLLGRFAARFGQRVAVLHSGLGAGEKRDEWLRILRMEANIVIGARSAVFAPVQGLRLIIVDEEHEPSYKQEDGPRYDAREVAAWRARRNGAVLVSGSATPSLHAMRRVEQGAAVLATMPQRVNGKPLPPVEVVDMREELRTGNRGLLSRALEDGLLGAVSAREQVILFLNRRGYAPFVLCRNCGDVPQCPRCDITLTLHRDSSGGRLECHYCGFRAAASDRCTQCGDAAVRPYGLGTQQVEEWLNEYHPSVRVLRMDVDTTRRKGAHQELIERFLRREADVLVGTQMVAKGLDFPQVSFVGVIAADTMLAIPDYRAAERTFQLLTQVAGRAGRAAVDGRTVIQTYRPDHYAIRAAASHDYAAFYRQERAVRAQFGYPPFCELAAFMAVHARREWAEGAAKRFERELRRSLAQVDATVLPAVPAAIEKVADRYRFQVVVKYSQWHDVRASVVGAFDMVAAKMRSLGGHCTLDVNAGHI